MAAFLIGVALLAGAIISILLPGRGGRTLAAADPSAASRPPAPSA